MIEAIYWGDYLYGDKNVPSASLQFHAKVSGHHSLSVWQPCAHAYYAQRYALGDKYDIPLLRDLAKDKFEFGCKGTPDAQHLTSAIEELYSSTLSSDRGLRDIAIRTAMANSQVLLEDSEFNNMVDAWENFDGISFRQAERVEW